MKEYSPKVLRKLQMAELEILKDFDALCKKHDIPYVLFFGSGIGALRHGGFIPWDDDIDVLLLREDYERFLRMAKEECSEKYYSLTAEEDENFPLMTVHWGPKNTKFVEWTFRHLPCKFTIFIDLFPLDTVSDDRVERRKQCITAWFWSKLKILCSMSRPVIQYQGLKRKMIYFVCGAVHIGMKILHVSPKWLYKKCKKACLRYENASTQRVAFLASTKPGTDVFFKDELFPPRYIEFEGVMLPFPREIEKLLERCYGDYMQLPPEDKRKNHFPTVLDFGDGEVYAAGEGRGPEC